MGLVKVEVPFEGINCSDCIYEESTDTQCLRDYCGLFEEFKATAIRCMTCVENTLREV